MMLPDDGTESCAMVEECWSFRVPSPMKPAMAPE
jgi:hypothetical protein